MIARVRGVIAASTLEASIWNVSSSESTKTGLAPYIITALTVATNVYGGTMTSSPGFRSSAPRVATSALVPLEVARQCVDPVSFAY